MSGRAEGFSDFAWLFESSPNPYMVVDRNLVFVAANAAYESASGTPRDHLIGRYLFDAFPDDPSAPANENARQLRASFERVLRDKTVDTIAHINYRVPRETPQGRVLEEFVWSATNTPLIGADGEVAYILQHTVNVTESLRWKAAVERAGLTLAQVEAGVVERARAVQNTIRTLDAERLQLRRLFEQAPGFMCYLEGPDLVFRLANEAYERFIGDRPFLGLPVREVFTDAEVPGFLDLLESVYRTGEAYVGRGARVSLRVGPEGCIEERYSDFVYQPIVEADGTVSGIFVQGHETTEQKRAENELALYREHLESLVRDRTRALEASEAERRQTEAALLHAQKMEAIGRLTGGVAHDFNNLLQVIGGNLQLLQRTVGGDARALRWVQTASAAVDRGAKLAAQLLAFARRQPLEARSTNLGALIPEMDQLLQQVLGESVELACVTADDLWNTWVDPAQLENVILNLAINARDAMPDGGRLVIEASNCELDAAYAQLHGIAAGPYVCLLVEDGGCGMTTDVLQRAFEPFFTTKPEGRGTGLGLSMVYGFVKQSGGHVEVRSAPGEGTAIRIYLPRCSTQAEAPAERVARASAGGSERILVVEDDPAVRETTVALLEQAGYAVQAAPDGETALAMLRAGLQVDLLFSDVVMPGPVRATELAREAARLVPGLPVLFASGYAENEVVHGGVVDPGVVLLRKPYGREELMQKLRALLGPRDVALQGA